MDPHRPPPASEDDDDDPSFTPDPVVDTRRYGHRGRGHYRSASQGSAAIVEPPRRSAAASTDMPPPLPRPPLQSALKKPGHRRVFSHGQIDSSSFAAASAAPPSAGAIPPHMKGHSRQGSKTDFILPPGHEDRERKRSSLHRSGSGSGDAHHHKRTASRSDSLGFSFRGHSRQASRTDSIYTLRQTTTNYRDKIFFWNKRKDEADHTRHRTVVPNHTVPSDWSPHQHPNHQYLNNYIRTTKYTVLSFLPKNLFEQFHRFANLYFLFIVLLNWVPAINAFGKEISMLPVIFVLGVTAVKDIFEDRRRYLSDKRVNNSTCRVYKSSMGRYTKCLWKDLSVGDIVHLSCNEMIPADILVLRSSDESGLCYIDTQNLDGEANLKQREVPRGFVEKQSTFQPQDFRSHIECDAPTTKIYRFHGSIEHQWGERVPVGKDNLLLRECVLKNTDFVEGIVIYAGHESKAMLNNGGPRYKRSKLERQMNLEVVWCVVILLILCFIGAVGAGLWLDTFDQYVPFLNTMTFDDTVPSFQAFLTFWTFIIILQIIIPLSLYVSLELAKLAQVYLMHQDRLMFDEMHQKRVECRALNIPEECGQIQYIFCDKTGTLTENNMVFKRCTVAGIDYAHNSVSGRLLATPSASARAIIPVNPTLSDLLMSMDIRLLIENRDTKIPAFSSDTGKLTQDFFLLLAVCNTVIVAKYPHRDQMNASGLIMNSQQAIAAAQSSTPTKNQSAPFGAPRIDETVSVSPSPPLSMMSTTSSTAPLQPAPQLTTPKRHRLLDLFPAKPLSPIHSSPESTPSDSPMPRPKHLQIPGLLGKLVTSHSSSSLSKQQHSRSPTPTPMELRPIYEAESPDELALVDAAYAYNCKLLKRTPNHAVVSLPGEGLIDFEVLHVLPFDSVRKRMSVILRHPISRERILFCKGADSAMFPRIEVTKDEQEVMEKTQRQLNNYAKQGLRVLVMAKRVLPDDLYTEWLSRHKEAEVSFHRREKLLMESYNAIECRMKLLGSTGIEDRLQEGVPKAIANLRAAGIVVWVLTGDKQETAINIAYSCKLFAYDMEIIKLNARSRDAADTTIRYHLDAIEREATAPADDLLSDSDSNVGGRKKRALVVDGKTLIYILDKRANLQTSFLRLTSHCSSVLCCRATPLQKAYIVRIVKEQLKMHTLAIGDGANDVSMIQTADVGVGISGQEGMQAVMASDFAISRFKYLERLLLVHGHWNYDRLSRMVLYFFYKNAAFVFVCFWYQLYCGFSGAVMIDQMYLMLYNLLFTSLPPMAIGISDQDCPDTVLMAQPKLYAQGRLGRVYKPHSFWINMADALYQSLVIFFVCLGAYAGSDIGIWEFGTVMCTQCLFVMSVHLAIETKSWTIIHWLSLIFSVMSYFVFALLYNGFCITCFGLANNPYWVIQHSMGTAQFWLIIFLTTVFALLPRLFVRVVQNTMYPSAVTRVMLARQKAVKGEFRLNSGNSWSQPPSRSSVLRLGGKDAIQLKRFSRTDSGKIHPVHDHA